MRYWVNLSNQLKLLIFFMHQPTGKVDDFDKLRTLGTGSFGRVMLMLHKLSKTYFAVKVLEKQKVQLNL